MCLPAQCQTYCATMTLVPNIVGQLLGDATYQLGGLSLRLGQVTGTNDPYLKVTAQSVSPGAEVPHDTPVAVTVEARPNNYFSSVRIHNWLATDVVVNAKETNGTWSTVTTVATIVASGVATIQLQNGVDYSFLAYCNQGAPACCDAYAPTCDRNLGLQSTNCWDNTCFIGRWGPTWHGDSYAGQLQERLDQLGLN